MINMFRVDYIIVWLLVVVVGEWCSLPACKLEVGYDLLHGSSFLCCLRLASHATLAPWTCCMQSINALRMHESPPPCYSPEYEWSEGSPQHAYMHTGDSLQVVNSRPVFPTTTNGSANPTVCVVECVLCCTTSLAETQALCRAFRWLTWRQGPHGTKRSCVRLLFPASCARRLGPNAARA